MTRDLGWLMDRGGWAKLAMAMCYAHVGTPDLAEGVLAHGWEVRADVAPRCLPFRGRRKAPEPRARPLPAIIPPSNHGDGQSGFSV